MKNLKVVTGLLVALVIVFSMFAPTMKVFATDYTYTISFVATTGHTLELDSSGTHLKIDGAVIDFKNGGSDIGTVVVQDSQHATITVTNGPEGTLTYNTEAFTLYEGSNMLSMNEGHSFNSNTGITVKNPSTSGGASFNGSIHVNVTFNNTEGEIVFNNGVGRTQEGASADVTLKDAGYTDSSKKNEIIVNTSFGFKTAKKITINGVEHIITDELDSHKFQVDGSSSYTIVVDGNLNSSVRRTIIWGNPGATDIDARDALIEHGSAKVIAVYDKNGNLVNSQNYVNDTDTDGDGVVNGNGWVSPQPGSRVVFEFVPEYGYQLTRVAANELELEAQSTTNQYVFTMPDTNVHFAATFTKTEDIVKAESEKVSGGNISLGNSLNGGTAQLKVSDVELSQDKITGFENAAGDYKISNYLDIDLYNVFYKGKKDANDVWSNKIDELDNEATITLKLADGVNGNDVVLVHNIHDGEQYEIIPIISYDPVENTITFKTKSFSNYALAAKTTSNSTSNPKTGDIIIIFSGMFIVSTMGFVVTRKLSKRK